MLGAGLQPSALRLSLVTAQDHQAEIQLALRRRLYRRYIVHCCGSIMTSTTSFGDANTGFQAGVIHGPVNTAFHLPPSKLREGPRSEEALTVARPEQCAQLSALRQGCAVLRIPATT